MTARTMHIAIDVAVDHEQISGAVGDGIGPRRPFSGWLGLIGVLDGLLGEAGACGAPQIRVSQRDEIEDT